MDPKQAYDIVRKASAGENIPPSTLADAGNVLYQKISGAHVCYQNDNFYVAVMCGLDERRLRFAAAQALNNAHIGYWEWKTHAGWDMQIALEKLEISDSLIPDISTNQTLAYCELGPSLRKKLVTKFQLPVNEVQTGVEPHPGDTQLKYDIRNWWREGVSPGKRFVAFYLGI